MKRILLILLFIPFLSSADAQWFLLNSGTTNQLNALCVVSPDIVYIAGNGGLILKTTDGGSSWSQKTPVSYNLLGISFTDQNTGMAAGSNGIILKTTDGGNVWFPLNSGVTVNLSSVWYYSSNTAIILQNEDNKYMTTSNGGTNWVTNTTYTYPWDFELGDMSYTNWGPRRGVFAGAGYRVEPPMGGFIRVLFTSNNAIDWYDVLENTDFGNVYSQVSILPDGRVFAVDHPSGIILTRASGAGTWESRGLIGNCNDLFFVNENSGTALKSDGIYRTSDGGWIWEKVSSLAFKTVAFADSNIGYVIGGGGAIAKTINGGIVRNFFPSELNNKYQTKIFIEGVGPGGGGYQSGTDYSSYSVIADTMITGKRFVRFNGNYPFNPAYYFHYDKDYQKLYIKIPSDDSIRLAADFNLPAGDTIISYISGLPLPFVSAGLVNVPVFGDSVLAYKMDYEVVTNKYSYTFAEDIGLSRFYNFAVGPGSYWGAVTLTLFSAIIDTIVYNPINLNISSISPLINRPVNTFPFVMNGSFETNLNMIDTFYVKITLLRGIDTVGSFSYPFNNNNATNITMNPQAGDRLFIKAYITDSSIFNNYDTFPDSGYAEILVLPNPVDVEDLHSPSVFSLHQNYPNPFNPSTNIQYSIPERSFISLIIYDAMGNEIARPVNEEKNPGVYNYQFDGTALASGVYFYKLITGNRSEVKKMLLIR